MKNLYQVRPRYNFIHPDIDEEADLELMIVAKDPAQACEFWCKHFNSEFDVNMAPFEAVLPINLAYYTKTNVILIRDISLDLYEIGSMIEDGVQPWGSLPVTFYEIQWS